MLRMIDLFDLLSGSRRSRRRYHIAELDLSPGNYTELPLAFFLAVVMLCGFLIYESPNTHHNTLHGALYLGSAAMSAYLWHHFWRLYHYIADTPTSRIASASQGLVELHGMGDLPPGKLHQGISMGPPCLWQAYTISEGEDELETGHSTEPFILQDRSGSCVIYPEGAIVITSSRTTARRGNTSASIRYLKPGADIYVLGELRSVGGDNEHYNLEHHTAEILRKWKSDQRQLVADFDEDGDGRIDVQEWEAARSKARTLAEQQIHAKRQSEVIHEIRKPKNGLPLLIADKDPDYLKRKYYWLGIASLSLAISAFIFGAIKLS